MNKTTIAAFGIGVIIGAWGMWCYIRRQEVEPVERDTDIPDVDDNTGDTVSKEDISQYNDIVTDNGYDEDNEQAPYVIYPEEYGALDDHETVSLLYYADGVLADDSGDKVEDIADKVGADFYTHFGEYEEDSVFIRNDARKCDYEILMDSRNYDEVLALRPRRRHDET